jgi:basic membrane protein A
MVKRLSVTITLLVILTLIAACAGAPAPEPQEEAPAPAQEQEEEVVEEAPAEEPTEEAAEEPAEEPAAEEAAMKFGEVTDVGGVDDKGFNQLAWEGLQRAGQELGADVQFLESQQQTDYEKNINEFLNQGYDGMITVGFLLADATKAASEANPDVPFAIVDFPSQTSGDMGLLFAVDEPSFMAGYMAAGMTETGIVCTYGGVKIPPVTQFMVAFEEGVNYYNEQKGTDVALLGWKTDPGSEGGGDGSFTGNFESLDDGRSFAENFFDEGCDIIFPVAGPVGLGSAAAAQDRGFAVIGVDADLTQTNPDAAEVYMTSVLKKIDVAVYEAVMQMADGTFEGGTNLVSTLENDGVGLAPYHDWEDRVPAELTAEIEEIRQGIIAGDISTGWPVGEEAPAAEAETEAEASDVSIVMSFVPSGDTESILASGDELAQMVADRTGYSVESNVATSYAAVIEAMGAGNAQIGWLNTFGYILAHEKYGVDVALATERFGATTYKGQIITRADSGIETIEDLAGTTFCRPDPLSTSGWIIPSITMAAEGLDVENDIEVTDVGSHDNVVSAVYNGDCDAGATYVDARGTIEDDVPDVKEQVIVIRESADIPNDTVSFAADVPPEVREAVTNALLDITTTEDGMAALEDLYEIAGLVPVDDTFYDAFRADLDASGYSVEDFQE